MEQVQNQAQQELESQSVALRNIGVKLGQLATEIDNKEKALTILNQQIVEAQQTLETVQQDNQVAETRNTFLKTEYMQFSTRLSTVKQSIVDTQQEEKVIREDLAARLKACDEREANLKVRENKVNQAEASIQRNASLLNL